MKAAAAWLLASGLAGALHADFTLYPAGRVVAPSSELAPFADATASGGAFLGSTEGPGGALLNPGSLAFNAYPFLAVSGVGPFNTATEYTDLELGFSQPLGDGALSLFVRDYRLGGYDLYGSQGEVTDSAYGLNGGNEFYCNGSLAWRLGRHVGLGAGLGYGYTVLPGAGTYRRPLDLSLGGAWQCLDAGSTVLSLALRQAPVSGDWLASSGSAALGLESDLWRSGLRAGLSLEDLFSLGWQGRAGLRWSLRDGRFSFLAGAVFKDAQGDPNQQALAPSFGLSSQFTNLAGTLALSYGDAQSYQFTAEVDWRFRTDAFSQSTLRGPDASQSYLQAGKAEQSKGHLAAAMVLFSRATEADPANAQAAQCMAEVEKLVGTAQSESARLREMRATAAYFSKLAEDYYNKGDLRRAADNLEQALKVDDQNRAIFDRLASIHAELDRKLESLRGRAAVAQKAGDVEAEAKACHAALALDPKLDWPQPELDRLSPAMAKLRWKLYLLAVDDYIAAEGTSGTVGDRLQRILMAISYLERSLALDPSEDEKGKLNSTLWKCGNLRRRLES